jgi:hypothetical protein
VLAAFDPVVARAMAKEPARRYASAAELARAIEAAFDGAATAMPDPEETVYVGAGGDAPRSASSHAVVDDDTTLWRTAPPPPESKRGQVLAGGAIVLALAGFLGGYVMWPDPPPSPPTAPVASAPVAPAAPAPAPAPVPVIPVIATPARPTLAALRAAVAPVECTLSNPEFGDDGTIYIAGLAPRGRPEAALRTAIGSLAGDTRVAWSLISFDGPYCEALNVLRPMRARDLRASSALAMGMKGDVTRLRQGDRAVLQIRMPDFAAHLQVDYLSEDGSIAHLLSDDGTDLRALAKDGMRRVGASHRYAPGERVIIGEPDPAIGFDGWEVDTPFGTDMIVVIASAAPLRRTTPPAEDSAAVYFRNLRAALEGAEAGGVALSAQALLIETVAR